MKYHTFQGVKNPLKRWYCRIRQAFWQQSATNHRTHRSDSKSGRNAKINSNINHKRNVHEDI